MEQTLEPGQYVLVDKLTPRWDAYNRGDIIVFNPPPTWTTDPTPFIKRVIGEPGDTVEVRDDGLVYVNGVALDEPYTYKNDGGRQRAHRGRRPTRRAGSCPRASCSCWATTASGPPTRGSSARSRSRP